MNRPQQVRAVFQELRQTVGHLYSAGELLEKAAALVKLFLDEDDNPLYRERMTNRVPFEERELHDVMADGGWRVLNHVYHHDRDLFDWQAFE
ncbi:MAG TPA: hypothetical protein DCS21_00715 [Gammaproteobacteria bacterium]|nr:hypothetical protein [Gammaproteobacteria bacterium]